MMLAVVSDIHGNRWALEAVLGDMEARGIEWIVNLGDLFYGPLDPGGVFDILAERQIPTVLGNEDRILLEPIVGGEDNPTLRFVLDQLDPRALRFLRGLPMALVLPFGALLCHGTPQNDQEYLIEQVQKGHVGIRRKGDVLRLLTNVRERVVLCGHSHLPRTVQVCTRQTVVNPGSVGLQAFRDHYPIPHSVETGSPHARYAILQWEGAGYRIEHLSVPYDHWAAADVARANGRVDWAQWLETGRV